MSCLVSGACLSIGNGRHYHGYELGWKIQRKAQGQDADTAHTLQPAPFQPPAATPNQKNSGQPKLCQLARHGRSSGSALLSSYHSIG